jgi:hypothetical protein
MLNNTASPKLTNQHNNPHRHSNPHSSLHATDAVITSSTLSLIILSLPTALPSPATCLLWGRVLYERQQKLSLVPPVPVRTENIGHGGVAGTPQNPAAEAPDAILLRSWARARSIPLEPENEDEEIDVAVRT